jgi:hypothetical protein
MISRQGKTVEEMSFETAAMWKKGLADSKITPDRLHALNDAVIFTIFTPGSDVGKKVSIISSFEAPPIPWEVNAKFYGKKSRLP